ncbi:MAG: methyl-accepting chemotaxis protein, partial [Xanthomonas perforans]|nr:methyl-accepting chemotaxis protein [Xanthomonas perforans]
SLREVHSLADADKQLIKSANDKLAASLTAYRATIRDDADRSALEAFEKTRDLFIQQQTEVLDLYDQGRQADAEAQLNGPLTNTWNEGRTQLTSMIELNRDVAYSSAGDIVSAVNRAELSMAISVLLAIIA